MIYLNVFKNILVSVSFFRRVAPGYNLLSHNIITDTRFVAYRNIKTTIMKLINLKSVLF